ncbi:WASH complex subunit 5-like [Tetranychus urticae]|uniref:WASH complex subunit 5-like n=1 Tax=Tetranychus urticae TaxID=32264 RepID=UPI00077BB148|nr:WASH complex subunit 5-like [Tetranychus urticae]
MADFLDESNPCGINLLRLVSRGNAIIAELLRLSDMIPAVFKPDLKTEFNRYSDIIVDFTYFKNLEAIEAKIDSTPALRDKDDEIRDNYLDILSDFYLAFESIHKYIFDLNKYMTDLEEGFYIQQTMETVMINMDGKQLMCEALYLCGVILLTVDQKIEGSVRERMLVSYYRYSAQRSTSDSNIDDVCNLLRSTGYSSVTNKRPVNYPEDFFKRVPINAEYLSLVIGRLRFDDVYNQLSSYPYSEHRSFAMSNQAAMLYVILYFAPDFLHNQHANMREIVDKFFSDNFVINIYMGIIVNLIEAWEPYRAAKSALNNTLETTSLRKHAIYHKNHLNKLLQQTTDLLKEGYLDEEVVLDSTSKLTNILRECNVTLRWLMLHTFSNPNVETHWTTFKKCKQSRDVIISETGHDPVKIFELLMHTSQLELKVKEIYKQLLNEKREKWDKYQSEAVDRISELSEVFSGNKPLTRIEPNSSLQEWFGQLASQIKALDPDQLKSSNRKTIQMIKALDEIQDFHQLEGSIQVKQHLIDARKFLCCMLKTSDVKEHVLITLQLIGDLSYAWLIIDSFTKYMQKGIQKDPTLVIKLRATFLKLASALDMPLLRINQASSPDLVPVSQYYSSELVSYVRKVLHIIPDSLFRLMARIIELQTNQIQELPTRLMKDQLRSYAFLEERYEVAQLTHSISVFTEGMLMMKTTLVGIIQIDPKKLLEDGIRKELVIQVAKALHQGLVFNQRVKPSELVPKLRIICNIMDGLRRSFEYIQDYVCIYGLKIWQEEVSRIVSYNVEQECNAFMRHKVLDWESIYQSKTIPVPKFPPLDQFSVNFIGRLTREILRITDPRTTIYVNSSRTWYDNKTRAEIVDPKLFKLLLQSTGTAGINGLDRLLSFMIVSELGKIESLIEKQLLNEKWWHDTVINVNNFLSKNDCDMPSNQANKLQSPITSRNPRTLPIITESIMKIGQMQLIKNNISFELKDSCNYQSRNLRSAYETLNEALLTELKRDPKKYLAKEESALVYELTNYLEWSGISDPLSKITLDLLYLRTWI